MRFTKKQLDKAVAEEKRRADISIQAILASTKQDTPRDSGAVFMLGVLIGWASMGAVVIIKSIG